MGTSSSKKPSPSKLRSNIEDQFYYSHNLQFNSNNELYNSNSAPQHYELDKFDRTNYDLDTHRRKSKLNESNRSLKPAKNEIEMNIERKNSFTNMSILIFSIL